MWASLPCMQIRYINSFCKDLEVYQNWAYFTFWGPFWNKIILSALQNCPRLDFIDFLACQNLFFFHAAFCIFYISGALHISKVFTPSHPLVLSWVCLETEVGWKIFLTKPFKAPWWFGHSSLRSMLVLSVAMMREKKILLKKRWQKCENLHQKRMPMLIHH